MDIKKILKKRMIVKINRPVVLLTTSVSERSHNDINILLLLFLVFLPFSNSKSIPPFKLIL